MKSTLSGNEESILQAWISLMVLSGSLATRGASPGEHAAGWRTGRKIIARLIETLHFSRRLEAARVLRRYHHLIAEDSQGQPKSAPPDSGKEEGSANCQPR